MNYTVIYSPSMNLAAKAAYPIYEKEGNILMVLPLNSVLASKIEDNSNVRVIIVETLKPGEKEWDYAARFKEETEKVLSKKGCAIEFVLDPHPFDASKTNIAKLYRNLTRLILPESTLLVDITFGPRYITLFYTCLLSYAERFLNCEIDSIVYGQADMKYNPPKDVKLCDVTSVYLLSSFSSLFGDKKEAYDRFIDEMLS